MELKIIADVGIIGLPNSGKSTLLNNLTRASAKIGTYQFTTLEPNLGVMFTKGKEITLADIPGLIENASKGKGLGHDFLRHIERTKILIHLIDGIEALSTNGINKLIQNYKIIQSELQSWNKKILNKPQIVVINKIDITEVIDKRHTILSKFQQINIKPFFISAITSKGVDEIIEEIIKMLDKHQKAEKKNNKEEVLNTKIYKIDDLPNKRIIFKS